MPKRERSTTESDSKVGDGTDEKKRGKRRASPDPWTPEEKLGLVEVINEVAKANSAKIAAHPALSKRSTKMVTQKMFQLHRARVKGYKTKGKGEKTG